MLEAGAARQLPGRARVRLILRGDLCADRHRCRGALWHPVHGRSALLLRSRRRAVAPERHVARSPWAALALWTARLGVRGRRPSVVAVGANPLGGAAPPWARAVTLVIYLSSSERACAARRRLHHAAVGFAFADAVLAGPSRRAATLPSSCCRARATWLLALCVSGDRDPGSRSCVGPRRRATFPPRVLPLWRCSSPCSAP